MSEAELTKLKFEVQQRFGREKLWLLFDEAMNKSGITGELIFLKPDDEEAFEEVIMRRADLLSEVFGEILKEQLR